MSKSCEPPAPLCPETVPIVFIHYGRARFLRQVLAAARRSNPDKTIYFLGDQTNQDLMPAGVEFRMLSKYRRGELLEAFRQEFVPIAGLKHHFTKTGGMETWLRFVFERWFLILEFLREEAVGPFWTFDSDTLIAGDLAAREDALRGFDATEQCVGSCLNGYVSSPEVVEAYCRKMIALYGRPGYLEAHRERLKEHSGLAFNEMDAWQTHRDEEHLHTVALGTPQDGEAFDDALGLVGGWEVSPVKVRGRIHVKRLVRDSRGGFFGFLEDGVNPVRLVTLNLSWLPDYVYRKLAPGCSPVGKLPFDPEYCREVDFGEPLGDWALRRGREWVWKLRSSRHRLKF